MGEWSSRSSQANLVLPNISPHFVSPPLLGSESLLWHSILSNVFNQFGDPLLSKHPMNSGSRLDFFLLGHEVEYWIYHGQYCAPQRLFQCLGFEPPCRRISFCQISASLGCFRSLCSLSNGRNGYKVMCVLHFAAYSFVLPLSFTFWPRCTYGGARRQKGRRESEVAKCGMHANVERTLG